MEKQSVREAKLAIRGAKYRLLFYTTNPYHLTHWFVDFYTKRFPPNRRILTEKGFQAKEFSDTKELFHYTNYRVNKENLEKEYIKEIESLKQDDPFLYDVVGIGLPGVSHGGLYSHLMKHISRLLQPGNIYSAGLDWGFVKDPLTCILIQTSDEYKYVNVVEEFYLPTESRWTNRDMVEKVISWFVALSQLYPELKKEGLIVYCDKTAIVFIQDLNVRKEERNEEWLLFIEVPQIEVEWRIGMKQSLISASRLNIAQTAHQLYHELSLAAADPKSSKLKLLNDCPDHMMDAFDYALTPWYTMLMRYTNSFYFPRGLKPPQILQERRIVR